MRVGIKFNLGPELTKFLTSVWSPQQSRDIMQIVENELAVNNFPNVWRTFQGVWAPLSPGYAAWKHKYYPGRKKWELTGASLDALSTPVNLDEAGGHVKHKHIYLGSPRSGVVVATYEIRAPAAGGYFRWHNDPRNPNARVIWTLMDESRATILQNGYAYLGAMLKGAGWG